MINLEELIENHIQKLSPVQDGKLKSCYRTFMANAIIWDTLSKYEKGPASRQIYDVIHSIKLITGLISNKAVVLKDTTPPKILKSGKKKYYKPTADHFLCPQAWVGDKMFTYKEFQDYDNFIRGFFLGACVIDVTSAENDGNKLPKLFSKNFLYTHPVERYNESGIVLSTERGRGIVNRQYHSLGKLVRFPQFYEDAVNNRETLRFKSLPLMEAIQ